MKNLLLPLLLLFFSLTQAQTFEWVNISPLDIQTNPTYLHGEVTVDNFVNPVSARLTENLGSYNLAYYGDTKIEKHNPNGTLIWQNIIYGKANATEIISDGQNNIICIGSYMDTISIESSQLIHSGLGTGSFVLKLDDSGNLLWLKDGSEYYSGYEEITALEKDGINNYLIGISNYPIESKIIRLDADGNVISTIQQSNVETVSDMDIDTFGNIWVTGFVSGNQPVSFNGFDTASTFSYTEYIVKYNSSGNVQWVNFVEDVTVQDFKIETDNAGNAYLSGNLFFGTSFGNLAANGPQWVYDYFVTKINPDGEFLWLREIPPGNTMGDATIGNSQFLFCTENGSVYITGFFRGTINFGNGVILNPLFGNDVFVIKYDADGEIQWAKVAGSNNGSQGSSLIGDENGNLYVSGYVGQNAVFDTISISGGYRNVFLTKLKTESVVSVENEELEDIKPFDDFVLFQNYPNPFNPSSKIRFVITKIVRNLKDFSSQAPRNDNTLVTLKVYGVLGNEVATLVNEEKAPGTYEVEFSSHSGSVRNLPSGLYFYTLTAGGFSETKKMLLLK